jgi:hypothetical protein
VFPFFQFEQDKKTNYSNDFKNFGLLNFLLNKKRVKIKTTAHKKTASTLLTRKRIKKTKAVNSY